MNSKMNTPQLFNEICLITDLDDTLLNSSHEISRENLEAIQEFIKLGGGIWNCHRPWGTICKTPFYSFHSPCYPI